MVPDEGGDGGAGACELQPAGQFVGEECVVERLAVRQDAGEELVGGGRPGRFVVAAGGFGGEGGFVAQPVVAEAIELGRADVQALGGGPGVELTGVERGEDFLNEERRNTMRQLGFFILGQSVSARTAGGQGDRSFSLWTLVEEDSAPNKTASVKAEAAAESLN